MERLKSLAHGSKGEWNFSPGLWPRRRTGNLQMAPLNRSKGCDSQMEMCHEAIHPGLPPSSEKMLRGYHHAITAVRQCQQSWSGTQGKLLIHKDRCQLLLRPSSVSSLWILLCQNSPRHSALEDLGSHGSFQSISYFPNRWNLWEGR